MSAYPVASASTSTARPLTGRSSRSFVAEETPSRTTTFKWVRGELIGSGSYGRVFLALNANSGELMAVKQVEKPLTASDRGNVRQREVVEALKFESRTLQLLGEHENIVQYLGFEENLETLNIFLEYIPGGTISSCLSKHGSFGQDVTKWFAGQILTGLEFLHSKKILHRDLKGENILVEPSGICKISDFGISRLASDKTELMTELRGTVFWMAPEVVDASTKGYDSKVDIWSLGCVVLEMWSGQRPWAGEEVISVMLKLYKDKMPPPIPPDIVAELPELALDFRRECFAINPRDRPSAQILRQHPYLTLPPGWIFQPSELESPPHKRQSRRKSKNSTRHRNSSAPASRHRRVATTETVPPLPPNPTRTIRPGDHLRLPSIEIATKPPSAEPPPVVWITPPSSPKLSSRNSSASATSESTRTSASPRPRKSFYIANPDPPPADQRAARQRSPFVFTPPPLPDPPTRPPPQYGLSVTPDRRLAPAASMQNLAGSVANASSSSSQQQQSSSRKDYDSYSDSDSDSYSGSMWKKPPAPIHKSPSPASGKASKFVHRRSIIESKRDTTWAPRPVVRDVYSRLEDFFPRVDLDKPIETPSTSGGADRQRKTKSIRMQVEDLNRLNMEYPGLQRTTTKLWGHRVEEVTSGH